MNLPGGGTQEEYKIGDGTSLVAGWLSPVLEHRRKNPQEKGKTKLISMLTDRLFS